MKFKDGLMQFLYILLCMHILILLIPVLFRRLLTKPATGMIILTLILMPVCNSQTYPHRSFKSSPIQRLLEKRPYLIQSSFEKQFDITEIKISNQSGFGSLVCVGHEITRYNILNAYLLHSFVGHSLTCIFQEKGQPSKRSIVINVVLTVAICQDFIIRKLNFACWVIEHIICNFELTLFITPLLRIINYVGEHQGENQRPKHETHSRSCKKRKLNIENRRTSKSCERSKDNEDDEQSPKRPKIDRHNGAQCGPCTIWIQTGSLPVYQPYHNIIGQIKHPNEHAQIFNEYLSTETKQISLREDSCLCQACYTDAKKYSKLGSKREPRWVTVHRNATTPQKVNHCKLCHSESLLTSCDCNNVQRWYDYQSWSFGLKPKFWNQYMTTENSGFNGKLTLFSVLCKKHYMQFYHYKEEMKCFICSSKTNDMAFIAEQTNLQESSTITSQKRLVCISCHEKLNTKTTRTLLEKDLNSKITYITIMAKHVHSAIDVIHKRGYILRKNILQTFAETLTTDSDELLKKFDNYINARLAQIENIAFYRDNSKFGLMIYNRNLLNEYSAVEIYKLLKEKNRLEKCVADMESVSTINSGDIRNMIDIQTKIFVGNMDKFDARKLFQDTDSLSDHYFLGKYLHPPLVNFIETIVGFDPSKAKSGVSLTKTRLKIQTLIALMCNIQNHKSVLLQSVIGLAAYAYGLRDKGFKLLNMFGITCGIDLIRRLANDWSKSRKVTEEVDQKAFWRVTFDNLNFKRKFAKTFAVGGEVEGRMLNLITGQVSHQAEIKKGSQVEGINETYSLTSDESFFLYKFGNEKKERENFLEVLVSKESERLSKPEDELKSTLLQDIKTSMKDFTPEEPDIVAYATVKTAQSAKIHDVSEYLHELKQDLKIGEEGLPEKVIIGGDQQTYAIVKNLMKKFPNTFDWIIPVPGDWHLLKNAAETLRDMLWDGGLRILSNACGHLKEINQWKDIHNVLTGLHESLLNESMVAPPLPKLNAALCKSCVKAGFSAAFLKKLRKSCVFFRPALKL